MPRHLFAMGRSSRPGVVDGLLCRLLTLTLSSYEGLVRNVCQVDVIVGARLKLLHPIAAAKELFKIFAGCRILNATAEGPRLKVTLLLPEMHGGLKTEHLKPGLEAGLHGTGSVFIGINELREATAGRSSIGCSRVGRISSALSSSRPAPALAARGRLRARRSAPPLRDESHPGAIPRR